MRSITCRLVVIAAIAGAGTPAAASAAPIDGGAALHGDRGLVCGTDYSRNSVNGEYCVPRKVESVPPRTAVRPASKASATIGAATAERRAGLVCRTDYSRNSVTGEDCVELASTPIPDVAGAAPFPPAVAADDDFSWTHAGLAGALAIVLLAGGTAVSRRRRATVAG